MASKHQDLWLWTSLGVFTFFAARAVHKQLYAIRTISEVTKAFPQQDLAAQATENGLKHSSLSQLAQSPNPDISAASVRIITDLALGKLPFELMLRDIAGRDEERRNRALTCLCFLRLNVAKLQPLLPKTYGAIIDCLCNLLPEANEAESNLPETNYVIRSQHFLYALTFLNRVLQFDFGEAVDAGLVTRWLKQYPFGGFVSKEYRKARIRQLLAMEYGDMPMYNIMSIVVLRSQSRHQLEAYGLLDKKSNEATVHIDTSEPTPMRIFDFTNGDESETSDSTTSSRTGRRSREQSLEELALRRRRREAMVLGENGVPLMRANIIEPS